MANQPLVLVLDAQTGKLKSALKDAGASLADYSKSAQQVMREVQDAMQEDLARGPEDLAKRLTKSLQQQINTSRRLAQSALDQGKAYNPLGAANSASSIAAAEAQERLARSFRDQAAAAAASVSADENVALGLRQVAVASELAASEAERQALALRKQGAVFAAIEAEMGVAAEQASTHVVGSHGRMSVSSMLLMHSVRSSADSFAAGLPPTMIFAEQIGRLGEAAALSEGSMGAFGAFMAGPWGIAVTAGVSVLGILINHLVQAGAEAHQTEGAHESLIEKLNLATHSYEEVTAALREYNHEQAQARVLALEEAQALKVKADALLRSAVARRQELAVSLESKRLPVGGNGEAATASANAQQANEARDLEKRIASNAAAITELGKTSQNAGVQIATELAHIATDPKYAIEQRFTRLKNEAKESITNVSQLAARLADLTRQQAAAEGALTPARTSRTRTSGTHAGRSGGVDPTPGRDNAYDAEYDRLTQQADTIARANVTDLTELARLSHQQVNDAHQRARDDIAAKGRRNAWSKADIDALLAKEAENTAAQNAAIDAKLKLDLARQDQAKTIAALEQADTLLHLQEQLAPTLAERVRIQQQILDNERHVALLKTNGDPAAIGAVNQEYDAKAAISARANADPLSSYIDQIKSHAGDMNTALKGVEADGLKSLSDGMVGIISGTESVGSAFKHMADQIIADLARIAIEKLIVSLIPGFADGGPVGGKGGGGFLGLADGGPVFGPGGPREDRIPAMLSHGEFVVNAAATRKHGALLQAINENHVPRFADGGLVGSDLTYPRLPSAASLRTGNSSTAAPITFDLRGAVMTEQLLQEMNQISARHAAGVLLTAPSITRRDIADQQRMRIP